MLVLGVDPGSALTGYGVVQLTDRRTMQLVECGVFRTRAGDPLPVRLNEIFEGVTAVIARHRPDALAVEDVFYSRNVRTTVALGHARGVVLLAGERAGLPVHEFPPAVIKKAVAGHGSATKDQVQYMVTRLLRLAAPPEPSDASDGVAAALTLVMQSPVITAATRAAFGA